MRRVHLALCAVLAGVLPIAACSSDGRVAFNGGLGGTPTQPPPSDDDDPTNPPPPPPANDPGGNFLQGTVETVVASAGNLVSDLNLGDNELVQGAGEAISPLALVSVANQQTGSGGQTALGLSVASETQPEGQIATLGLLNDGQVLAANSLGPIGGDLLGAQVNGSQVVGEGQTQQIGLGLLAPTNVEGQVAGVNVLTNGEIISVSLPGVTDAGPLQGLTDTVEGVLDGGGLLSGGGLGGLLGGD